MINLAVDHTPGFKMSTVDLITLNTYIGVVMGHFTLKKSNARVFDC